MTCENCVHWSNNTNSGSWGICDAITNYQADGIEVEVYSEYHAATVHTRNDFECSNYEEKDG